jgi:large subunit ribosomal protein L24
MKKSLKKKIKLHIKLKDKVKIISGQEKGKIGIVKKIIQRKSQIIIEGINIKNKYFKRNRSEENGMIKKLEFPIHSSNVLKYEE